MKKILALLMAVAMLLALCACGAADTNEAADPVDTAETEETEETAKVLVMATNATFPPYEYYENDQVVGIDAEIGAAIAEKLGMGFEIMDIEFDAIIPAVVSGKADMGMAGMTVTPDRLENVNFSTSYSTAVQVVIVAEGSDITSVDDLFAEGANHTIGVQLNTTGDIYTSDDIEAAGLGTIERYNKGADAVAALAAGKIDCVVIDNEPAKAFVEANEGLTILDTEYALEEYAICFAKDNDELTEAVNGALEELIADGTVQAIVDKYITD